MCNSSWVQITGWTQKINDGQFLFPNIYVLFNTKLNVTVKRKSYRCPWRARSLGRWRRRPSRRRRRPRPASRGLHCCRGLRPCRTERPKPFPICSLCRKPQSSPPPPAAPVSETIPLRFGNGGKRGPPEIGQRRWRMEGRVGWNPTVGIERREREMEILAPSGEVLAINFSSVRWEFVGWEVRLEAKWRN